jgi:hypothetical protein
MVEFVAKAQFPEGVDLAGLRDPDAALARTRTRGLLATDGAGLFEAAARFGRYYVRADILRRRGGALHLIEVKSSSLGPDDDPAAWSAMTTPCLMRTRSCLRRKPRRTTAWRTLTM